MPTFVSVGLRRRAMGVPPAIPLELEHGRVADIQNHCAVHEQRRRNLHELSASHNNRGVNYVARHLSTMSWNQTLSARRRSEAFLGLGDARLRRYGPNV